ncbi:hypothetical protein CXG81DRAFT_16496 [Caulochytrium protostelioides]|uniref:Elongation factor Ts, mitochondrial n=1 Tax=Caulochytrium protostelioides TaxID=1555241 RepID=A0A4P9XFX6_9FUNG|nr:hypothetical protein CXG81DRAFT_16496 [Caulochytrium protostelioides]|eukprot:RKP04070.1 hypothetical protein CXG81DRAFT_16496 [Caulochytrium protostelioides]
MWGRRLRHVAPAATAALDGGARRGLHASRASCSRVAVIARLRKETQCSMAKVRQAVEAAAGDYDAARRWLDADLVTSGRAKSAKLGDRAANEGCIAVLRHPSGALGLVAEVNCETDFVAKSDVFQHLVRQIGTSVLLSDAVEAASAAAADAADATTASTTVRARELDVEALKTLPTLMPPGEPPLLEYKPLSDSLAEAVGKLGENVVWRRAAVLGVPVSTQRRATGVNNDARVSTGLHAHGGDAGSGRVAGIVVLQETPPQAPPSAELDQAKQQLADRIAAQVVGMAPVAIGETDAPDGAAPDDLLLNQAYLFGDGSVSDQLLALGSRRQSTLTVSGMLRWELGGSDSTGPSSAAS